MQTRSFVFEWQMRGEWQTSHPSSLPNTQYVSTYFNYSTERLLVVSRRIVSPDDLALTLGLGTLSSLALRIAEMRESCAVQSERGNARYLRGGQRVSELRKKKRGVNGKGIGSGMCRKLCDNSYSRCVRHDIGGSEQIPKGQYGVRPPFYNT